MKLRELSNEQLQELVEQFSQKSFADDSLIRQVTKAECGEDSGINYLFLAVKMLPLLMEKITYPNGWIPYVFGNSQVQVGDEVKYESHGHIVTNVVSQVNGGSFGFVDGWVNKVNVTHFKSN